MFRFLNRFRRQTDSGYKPVILITGCASGIGYALAKLFYGLEQYRIVITARAHSLEGLRLEFKESDRFLIKELDVTNDTNRCALISEVHSHWNCVDILINNAGISYRSVIEDMSNEEEFHQISTNYLGPMALIRLVVPAMRRKGRGKIINISSVSGMLAMPTMASYSASKYALEGASEALWYEMRPFGIDVCQVQPGFINSKSFKKVYWSKKAKLEQENEGPYLEYYENMTPFVEKLMGLSKTPPEKVASLVYKIVKTERPPLWTPATFDALVFYYLRRLLPRRWLHPILYSCLPGIKKWGKRTSNKRSS